MSETRVERDGMRRRKAERRLAVLTPAFLVSIVAMFSLILGWRRFRFSPDAAAYWDLLYAVAAAAGLLATGSTYLTLRDWSALPGRWRFAGLAPGPAFAVYAVVLLLMLTRF